MTKHQQSLEAVQHYYGEVLKSSADLQTSACCVGAAPASHIADALKEVSTAEGPALAITLTAFATTGGAIMAGRRLLPVLAKEVSTMTPSTGLFANLGTAILVLSATPLGLPVSTTHVAAGSLIGVRVADNAPPRAHDALRTILMAWFVTLPAAAVLSACLAFIVAR